MRRTGESQTEDLARSPVVILGIDPGLSGALAFLRYRDGSIAELEDMPVIGNEVNAHLASRLIQGYGPIHMAVVERAQSMPKQGISGAFNYGVGYGKLLGILATLDIPITLVSPSVWKTKWNLGKNKNLARQRACERWPDWSDHFARVKDDGRAEACLLTSYWITSTKPSLPRPKSKRPSQSIVD